LPAGVTCAFNPVTIDPGAAASTSQLTIAVGTTYIPPNPYVAGSLLMVGMLGMLWGTRRKEQPASAAKSWALGAVVLMLALTMAAVGCGYSSKGRTQPGATVMVVGTSGGVSHAAPLALTIQ
jgi:peptidoglycan/LPS O-acetylase OafA/YrhL